MTEPRSLENTTLSQRRFCRIKHTIQMKVFISLFDILAQLADVVTIAVRFNLLLLSGGVSMPTHHLEV